ncbi:RNA repair transcriptional activator RtcR [Paraliomyxa miuraensis]|uniref:RNA repair transcriptional activator RtcR n=1 Tax=Paraliomyxa miuraensis TaxID=376150 RepID=UPI00224F1F10|nr:RNA repair transcriptional activator RtcR [Paraliomyxa miuraensis]MCX4241880.1 RNA repair transcriptional activator RtcR [Paraliomyxa miuraensis]
MARTREPKPVVVLGLVGSTLDAGVGPKRWGRWRPTVDLCRHEDLLVSRFELLHQPHWTDLARTLAEDIVQVSPETEVRPSVIEMKDPWDFEEVYAALLDFVRAQRFRPEAEDYLVHITTGTHVAQICWFLLTESRELPARLLQTSPPGGRTKGGDPGLHRIIDLDLSKYDQIASRFRQDQREGLSFLKAGIDTKNRAFNELIARVEQVAIRSRSPVLLTGPTGAGKTRLARRIYELKRQRKQVSSTGRFMEINCATLRGDQAMSMLFGHAKGAFTGAVKDRPGVLASANGGVLFLDEIGELGLDEQAMLLRAIEDKRFLPVGSDHEVESDFQLIAGTNRDLGRRVREGRFREDLLARIDLWTFELPGLRERPEDIPPNLEYELQRYAARENARVTFSREAQTAFLRFATSPAATWAGNFRDFSAAVERMATLAPGGRITAKGVAEETERLRRAWGRGEDVDLDRGLIVSVLGEQAYEDLDLFDRVQLAAVLRVCKGSRSLSEAGRTLFAASRRARTSVNDADRLRKYLAKHGLHWQDLHGDGAAS